MSIELILTTFEDPLNTPHDAAALAHLTDSLRDTVRKLGGSAEDVQTSAEEVQVHLPGGTAVIHSDHAIFPIEELDPLTLGVVYDLAKTADMNRAWAGSSSTSRTRSFSPLGPPVLEDLIP